MPAGHLGGEGAAAYSSFAHDSRYRRSPTTPRTTGREEGGTLLDLTAASADRYALALLAGGLGLVGALLLRRRPDWAVGCYLLVLCFVPVWAGVQVKAYLEPQTLMAFVVLAVVVSAGGRLGGRVTAVDAVVAAFFLVSLVPVALGGATVSTVFTIAVQWLGAYLVGRLVCHRVDYAWLLRGIAVVFTVVAVLAVIEYLTGENIFLQIPGAAAQLAEWGTLQGRGDVLRAEGAFGHSIALGAALAMAIPLTLASDLRPVVRVVMVAAMLSGVAVTFSRIGLITAALGIALSLVALRDEMPARLRITLAGVAALAGAFLFPVVRQAFAAAGDEAADSAAYRGDLLSLTGEMRVLGLSGAFNRSPTGRTTFGEFRSIDSALMLQGLTYGWLSLVVALVLLAVGTVAVLTGRASGPAIAVVAQIPALATVALITQYSAMIWFVAGLAVYATTRAATEQRAPIRRPAGAATPLG